MGGALAQQVALAHPGRVDSLILISTSPAVPGGPGRAELPRMSEELRAYFAAEVPLPDWTERTAVIDYMSTTSGGWRRRITRRGARARAGGADVDRTDDMAASVMNHALAEELSWSAGGLTRSPHRPW